MSNVSCKARTAADESSADTTAQPAILPFALSPQPLLLSTDAARRQLSCGKTKLFQLIRERKLETVQLGTRRLVVAASVQQFVERLRQAAS